MDRLPTIDLLGLPIDLAYAIPIAAFVAIAVGTWAVLDMLNGAKAKERRLDLLSQSGRSELQEKLGSVEKVKQTLLGVLRREAPRYAEHVKPTKAKEVSALKARLAAAGYRQDEAQAVYLGSKVLGLIGGALLGGVIFLIINGMSLGTLIRAAAFAGIFFYLPDIHVWWRGRKRKEQIFLGLPDVLDLLVVCVEAGLGLDQAMRKVAEEMAKSYPVLSEEFGLCTMQMQMGKRRSEVMMELGQRTGVDDLRALATIIIQAEKFGSSVAQALRVQSDSMRTKRRQIAEEKAAKTAVQLIFPLVLFIFPAIFVVLVGPAAITVVNEMLPMMAGQDQQMQQ
ncbi:MAG TPA: secretion protein [Planctomycetaceae bacterium]|nr:secretion protein [Planctomycetaceae bacterium]HRE99528.1 type II secretion system F family protein [Pirellulaceae bacterium]